MADKTEINLARIRAYSRAHDAWNEGDHPRKANGQFGKGGGGSAAGGKKDTSYTYSGNQDKYDVDIRNNSGYIGNKAIKELLGHGDADSIDGFKFVKSMNTRRDKNSPEEVTVEYTELWNDGGKQRRSTMTTTVKKSDILK